jgi:hypothetical protein
VVSGGQSGVDRAALDAAREAGLETGGWCPRGRWAEDGPVPERYALRETPDADPAQRTRWNVRDSDATLILARGAPSGGTALSLACAREQGRPHLVVDLDADRPAQRIARWLTEVEPAVLNVAGPRESEAPGLGETARALLMACLTAPGGAVPHGEQTRCCG